MKGRLDKIIYLLIFPWQVLWQKKDDNWKIRNESEQKTGSTYVSREFHCDEETHYFDINDTNKNYYDSSDFDIL